MTRRNISSRLAAWRAFPPLKSHLRSVHWHSHIPAAHQRRNCAAEPPGNLFFSFRCLMELNVSRHHAPGVLGSSSLCVFFFFLPPHVDLVLNSAPDNQNATSGLQCFSSVRGGRNLKQSEIFTRIRSRNAMFSLKRQPHVGQ